MGHVRIRQHVNPLSSSFTAPVQVPEWKEVFRDSTLPLMVDIGCGTNPRPATILFLLPLLPHLCLYVYKALLLTNISLPGSGRFLIWLAKNSVEPRNYLGLEIRQKLVQRHSLVKELGLENIYFLFANVSVSFDQLVSSYPGSLKLVSILCPDPHFKQRHHKRRVVQAPLVDSISKNLSLGGQVLLQSDVLEVASDMRDQFDAYSDVLEHVDHIDSNVLCDAEGWLLHNPMGIRTEREIHAELEGARIYRRMYQKTKQPS
ncbi:tRNA (guanine-N(7)-)-methyltransferase [Ananas comosus]|uniref:tRNA (guanine(46)-N(7))-methyltransferase n=1 Tax=Ananas comosus TaxID=4615 RepID=A0A199UMS7_ANACO|nr:tRNA (guanine-N(7)-)-methyltransferase [Ananas comosus]